MVVFIKTIGIIIREFSENNKEYIGTKEDVFKYLYNYKINIMGIPISNDFSKTKNLVDMCDGIILSGGSNFVKEDFLLVNYLYEKDIPTLGICLGMQAMGRYFSSSVEVDIPNHLMNDEFGHFINISSGSVLEKIMETNKMFVNSRHKSAIEKTNLLISARSEDGVIEGIEDKNKKFFIGVQWHPESLNNKYTKKLFDYFINIL